MKDSGDSKDQQLMVALRVRPISVAELEEGATLIAHKVDEQMVVLMDPMEDPDDILRAHRSREKSYLFDVAFDFTATQEMVYQATTKSLIEGVISGYNATVFAYGPTGCGKTYTMLGTDHEPGIYVRTLNDLFCAIEETSDDMEYEVSMSYLEIMQLLMRGNRQRTQEPTAANQTSSRSHAVLQVAVRQRSRVRDVLQEVRQGRLFMIDLAGSERASQTQNRGQRMKEGAHINRSLLALGNCINALSGKGTNKYINYRDSKLTRLLKDSLGGNSRTVMIAHISPASSAFEESRNTLTYAGRAKSIKTRVKQNLLSVSYHIAQYTNIIADLRSEIQRLKRKIEERGGRSPDRAQLGRGDIRHNQAEVQLHSGQGEQAAMEHLREQLISTFQEQMDTRRRLLELENRRMELEMDTSRHLLTIASWKHKARRALKWREERRKESSTKDDTRKDLDTGDNQPDIEEPTEVVSARESIGALMTEQKKLRKQKLALEQRCRELRARGGRLEETLPRRVSSEQQREALGLLCRVHELELENVEMQSQALRRDGALRHRREALRRLEQRRSLCEEIIRAQRQLIQDCNLAVPQHLKELYEVYLREQEEGNLERATMMDRLASRALQDSALPKISPPGTLPTPEESDLETIKMPNSESPHQHSRFLPLLSTESEVNHEFKASSRAWQAKGSSMPTPPPILASNLVMQEAATQVGLNSQISFSPESIKNLWEIPLSHKGRKETTADTKSIAVKAAQRRSQALGAEGRQLLPPTLKHSSLSLHSLGKTDDVRLPGPLACKRPPSPTLQHAASEDSLSSSTGEAPSRVVERHGNGPCPALQGQKKSLSKKQEESLEAKRKRKSQSFEVTGQGVSLGGQELGVSGPPPCRVLKAGLLQRPQGTPSCAPLSMECPPSEPNILYQIPTQLPAHLALQPTQLSRPKMHVTGPRPMENHTPEQRLPVVGHLTPTIQHMGKATLPMAKVKLPPCQNLGPEDPSTLAAPSNPADVSERAARMPRLPYGTGTQGKNGRLQHN
ncbi:kinesin-like protein KIF19 isoform X2 [Ovis aries]|uniref:kinesin-like protein KIF19 isoform X2 n=1 Tax=Ovis aries TaxID=9940 RepID=UPI001C2EEC81|nr:kinesin-like protein KIF19 isoform X2 [Ovis aries]